MKIFYIIFLLFGIVYTQPQGFFLNDWQNKTFLVPAFIDTTYPDGNISESVTIDIADTVTKVSKYVYAGNANVYSTIMHNNPALVNNIKNLNPHVWRYPGGSLSDEFFWDRAPGNPPQDIPAGSNVWYGRNEESWTMSIDNYYQFLDSVNCEGLITINYGYARYGTSADPVANAAHMAAEWVRYDNGRTRFWEIGNENFGNWEAGYEIDTSLNQDGQPQIISGSLYGKHVKVFFDSMKAAAAEIDHEIYIGVVTFEAETSWDAVQTNWNEGMIPQIGDITDFYVIHNYFTPYDENSSAQVILGSYSKIGGFIHAVNKDITDAGFSPKPIVLNEWNIFAVGSMQQVSHINGMHAALILGESILQGLGFTARWDIANGWDDGDDHGMFSTGGEPDVELFAPRPVFYHMTWFQRTFGDVMVSSSGLDKWSTTTVYASAFGTGEAGIIIVNRANSDKTIDLNFLNYDLGDRCYWYVLEGGDDNGSFSRKVFINGQGPDGVAGGPEDYNSIPAYSTQITGGSIKVALPGYSVVYMLVEGEKSITSISMTENSGATSRSVHIYPNPSRGNIHINSDGFNYNQIVIYNILGQKVFRKNVQRNIGEPFKLRLDLAKGIYFIQLKSNIEVRTQKIMVY